MVKRLILSVAIIILAIFLGMFLSWQYSAARQPTAMPEDTSGANAPKVEEREAEAPPETQQQEPPLQEQAEEAPVRSGYYLRDCDGRIAVFPAGSDTPELVFDVYTRMLPPADQELLAQGVYVADYEELTRLVEDYIS